MRVFMLGWEFPPYISGGLGTACQGLTKALSRQETQITFVLPKPVQTGGGNGVRVLAPAPRAQAGGSSVTQRLEMDAEIEEEADATPPPAMNNPDYANVKFRAVPARITNPYGNSGAQQRWANMDEEQLQGVEEASGGPSTAVREMREKRAEEESRRPMSVLFTGPETGAGYGGDLMTETHRYAKLCTEIARRESFDVIHAHDWMTFPAGMAVAAATGKPLVVHVHSTEFDRAGENIQQVIYDIERRGMHAAVRVVAVSHLTRTIIEHRYGVDPRKIAVVYNGVEPLPESREAPARTAPAIASGDKIVLFLGRITMQKGPEYFVGAARKVLEKIDNVKFVMAGSGDMVAEIIEQAAREGLGHKITFTGFLRGEDVERIFDMADVYVMPSVSEPFGIAALEAIRHDVPVIVSRTSGVSEVLKHALKVNFWDTHEIANKIIAVLKHPPLASTMRTFADMEARRLTWDDAAEHCRGVYEDAVAAMPV